MRAVVVAVVSLALVAGLVSCGGSRGAAKASPPSRAAAQRVLADLASAVRTRNAAALDSVLAPGAASARFRAEQRNDFANLSGVPLAAWGYTLLGTISDPESVRAARGRYGSATLLLHVTLDYEFAGIDTVPSSHDQYLVFLEQDGRTYLAGDDAQAGLGGTSWDGPWHYGPLTAARGMRTLVLGPPGDPLLGTLATETDAAITAVTAVWGTRWSQRVAVIVPTSQAEFTALTGEAVTDVAAAAISDGTDATSDTPAGQRLVLDPAQLGKLTPRGRGIVLRHEITHLASAADTADITPRWLVEGLAEYVANLGTGQSVRAAAAELQAQVAAGKVPATLPSAAAFADAPATAYEQAWLACRLIAARAGQAGLLALYRSVGAALEPSAPAVAHAFAAVLHEGVAAFTAQWRTYLKDQLR